MLRTYKGRYECGRIVFSDQEQVPMPDTADVIITILDEENEETPKPVESDNRLTAEQQAVALDFLRAVQVLRKSGFEPEDEEAISDFQSGKYKPIFEVRQRNDVCP